ncbi:MAG: 2-oxo acid dehydrogenase subunit E2 [Planctomycetaceae bacterium]|nr:2-oxo acid dehydrogenase subunit E2 [Planctomycetaceae bacterium]
MAESIKMPQLGLTMTEGTVVSWLKNVGDAVAVGDPVLEISTDKLTTEVQAEAAGVLLAQVAKEGDELPVQAVLGYIGQPGESVDAAAPAAPAAPTPAAVAPATATTAPAPVAPAASVAASGGRVKSSPLARKIAASRGIDLASVQGTGPGGRIAQKDVLAATAAPAGTPAPAASTPVMVGEGARREKLTGMRKTVAERMLASHLAIPPVTQTMKVDVTDLMRFRAELNADREKADSFSLNDLVLKSVAKALAKQKTILVSLDGNEVVYHDEVNLGMAVALDSGLIVPVIRNADQLSLETLSARAKDLARKAREGGLSMDDYQGSTFTVSNLGMFGVEHFTPIVNQPNAAILGVCAVQDELALDDETGAVTKRKVMRLSMTYDHRLLDGAVAARFKQEVKRLLEKPMEILL